MKFFSVSTIHPTHDTIRITIQYIYQPMSAFIIAWNHPKTLTIIAEVIWFLLVIESQRIQWLQGCSDLFSKSVVHRYIWLGKRVTQRQNPTRLVNVIRCNISPLCWWDVVRFHVSPSTGESTSPVCALYFARWEASLLKTNKKSM